MSKISNPILILALTSGPLMAVALSVFGGSLSLTSKTLLYLSGALIPLVRLNYIWAFGISLENFLILNFFFTPPLHTLTIKDKNDFVTLMVFLILSIGLSAAINQRGIYSPTFSFVGNQVQIGEWRVDFEKELVTSMQREGSTQHLTPTEWKFLKELFKAKGGLVSQSEILHKVWGNNYEKESHYLRLFMSQLRKKLEPNPSTPHYLLTEPGRGYRLKVGNEN
jgi:DNA-binding winged helix-turn-helix (wHTH) protein